MKLMKNLLELFRSKPSHVLFMHLYFTMLFNLQKNYPASSPKSMKIVDQWHCELPSKDQQSFIDHLEADRSIYLFVLRLTASLHCNENEALLL